jgi:PAS domain S-box-containing protein
MTGTLRVIHLEDIRSDADIVRREMKKSDLNLEWKWVATKNAYEEALSTFNPDVILSDHSLPGYSSVEAFRALKASAMDVPFILITATISEEFAVMMMKEGIADYLLKDRLQRLPVAVTNALEKWESEKQRRKYMEDILRNERRFRGLIENSHDLIGITDENFALVYVSPSFVRVTGWTMEERRRTEDHLIHPDNKPAFAGVIKNSLASPARYFDVISQFKHKDGYYIWLEGTVINLLDDEAVKGIVFNLRDVTASKEAEESLRKSQANLAAIIDNANVSIYSIDSEFRYLTFNTLLKDMLKNIYGLNIKVGDIIYDFLNKLDPAEADSWRKIYSQAFEGQSISFEKEFKIGTYHSFTSFQINPIRSGDRVIGLSCFAWDVTRERLAALKVKQNEARFRALIENNYDAIIVRDESMEFTYYSPSIHRMLGYTAEDLEANRQISIVHKDDREKFDKLVRDALENPGRPLAATLRVQDKSGNTLWTEGVITNMLDNESVQGIVSNFRDITERKEAELQREKITEDLIERNNNLEQYAYIVSHNLRAPVANIMGLCNILKNENFDKATQKDAINHLYVTSHRLDDVIRDLNLVLQLRQSIDEQREPVALQQLVDETTSDLRDAVDRLDVEIITDFTAVRAIPSVKSFLYSIFYNLISNSIKFRRRDIKTTIEIRSYLTKTGISIQFKDNGLGIDLTTQGDKVFGLYKRFHGDHIEGKGFGLFMTRSQVEALDGKISIKSEVNSGTEFLIEFQ